MSDLTIEAVRVARSVGLPGVWRTDMGVYYRREATSHGRWGNPLDLSDPQTAFGVALKLDEWELASGNVSDQFEAWVVKVGLFFLGSEHPDHLDALGLLIARITQIYYDHEIRRALGWGEPEAGTLAKLEHWPEGAGNWSLTGSPGRVEWFSSKYGIEPDGDPMGAGGGCRYVPALADEALAAIHAEVCGGG